MRRPLPFPLRALPVLPEERRTVTLGFLYFFALLSGYSILRPVRDEVSVRAGVGGVPWLFTGTLVAMLATVAAFGALASRVPRRRLFAGLPLFLCATLALLAAAPVGSERVGAADRIFFVWVAVVGLFSVSVSWSFMTDLFRPEQARRLFGVLAAGATAGSLAGTAAVSALAPAVASSRGLLGVASILFGAGGLAGFALRTRLRDPETSGPRATVAGGAFTGIRRTLESRGLLGLSAVLACGALISTFLYVFQTDVFGAAIPDSGARTALFARMDLAVNVLSIVLQLFVAAPLIRRMGSGGALALTAGLVTLGVAFLAVAPGVAVVAALQVVHRAGHFALGRPARETLLLTHDAETRYKAKGFIDTAVYRAGDSAGAWLLVSLRHCGLGLSEMAWLAVPVGVLWTVASYATGRSCARGPA